MAWNDDVPYSASGTSASVEGTATDGIRSNWAAIEAWQGVEHYDFTNAASGRHKEGVGGFIGLGTAPTTAESGAMDISSSAGDISVFSSGGWYNIAKQQFKFRGSREPTLGLAAGDYSLLSFYKTNTFDFDPLSGFSTVTNVLTVPVSGYYMIRSSVLFYQDSRDYYKDISILVNGTIASTTAKYGKYQSSLFVADIIKLSASDQITIKCYNGDSQVASALNRDLEVFRL